MHAAEVFSPAVRVLWRDHIQYTDDREDVWTDWKPNQIKNVFVALLAALLKGHAGYAGISYFAVGEGLVAWDATPPTLVKTATTLETETYREVVTGSTDIAYLDALGGSVVGGPTRFIRITVVLGTADANGDLREWGLFGGTATATLDSGEIIDQVSHALIVKDSAMIITRTIEFELGLP